MVALGADPEKGKVERARRLLYADNRPLVACASIPVLGELILKLAGRGDGGEQLQSTVGRLERAIRRGSLKTFGLGAQHSRTFLTAQTILKAEPMITPTDALIVACAFEDELAQVLLTTDRSLLDSLSLARLSRDHQRKILPLDGF